MRAVERIAKASVKLLINGWYIGDAHSYRPVVSTLALH